MSGIERIAHAVYRLDVPRIAVVPFDLHPQPADVDIHRPRVAQVVRPPHLFQNLVPGEHDAPVAHQMEEEIVFTRKQMDGPSIALHRPRDRIDNQAVCLYRTLPPVRSRAQLDAAERSTNASEQLAEGKRLDHVIVSAQLEPEYTVYLIVTCGDHNNWYRRRGSHHPAYIEAVHLGQHDIQQHQIGLLRPCQRDRLQSGTRDPRLIPFGLEVIHERFRQISIVLHHEDALRGVHAIRTVP